MATDRPGARQTACRVVVDGVWDSGVREGADSLAFRYEGPGLKPMRRYTWRVSVRDELNNWSEPVMGSFSTGTLGGEAWRQTAWIHPVDTNVPGLRVAGFRKVVSADRPVREAEPGYRRIRLEPMPDARLGFVSVRFRSPMGEITSDWRREGDKWRWCCTVPPNTEADVRLPDGRTYVLGPGWHETVFGAR